jgi:hypothetical protein
MAILTDAVRRAVAIRIRIGNTAPAHPRVDLVRIIRTSITAVRRAVTV